MHTNYNDNGPDIIDPNGIILSNTDEFTTYYDGQYADELFDLLRKRCITWGQQNYSGAFCCQMIFMDAQERGGELSIIPTRDTSLKQNTGVITDYKD